MALYKKSSVEIPPVDKTKTTEKKDTIKVVKSKILSQREINEPSLQSKSQNTPSEPFSLSPMQKIGLVGAGLLGTTAGGAIWNYKSLSDYENAMKVIDPEFKLTGKKMKSLTDAGKNILGIGKTKIPSWSKGTMLESGQYDLLSNAKKTIRLGTDKVFSKSTKPTNVEEPPVPPDKPNVKINTAKSGYTEGPFPIETKPTVAPEANKKVFSKTKGRVSKFQKMMEADVFPSPTNASTSGNLYSGINPDSKAVKNAFKVFKKAGNVLLNNAGAIGTAGAYMMNEQESVDKYGVGAKAVVDNIINTSVDIVNPLNYLRIASSPTNLIAKYGGDNIISNTAKKVSGAYDTVINTAENSVYNNFNKRMQEENNSRNISEDKKLYNKMKSTPDYTVSDIQKAVMYGDTKRSGLEALETISASTGIPIDKLLSEGRKIWSKRKK